MIDAATGRGVPLIELRTPDGASYLTDSQGVVAFDDLSAMGRRVRFEVSGDGYRLPDPSGAVELEPTRGRARGDLRSTGSTSPSVSTA